MTRSPVQALPAASGPARTAPSWLPRIQDARLYLCTDARKDRGDFTDFLHAAYAGGVDIIQLRDKSIQAGEELELLAVLDSVAQEHSKLWAVNDRADLACLAGAPVFHIGQQDLPAAAARSLLPPGTAVGLSSHTAEQVCAAASEDDVSYFCVGPLWATPTKPGRTAVGLGLLEYAATLRSAKPWFAFGGIDLGNVEQVVAAGASRIVVVRAITEATDPTAAAHALVQALG